LTARIELVDEALALVLPFERVDSNRLVGDAELLEKDANFQELPDSTSLYSLIAPSRTAILVSVQFEQA